MHTYSPLVGKNTGGAYCEQCEVGKWSDGQGNCSTCTVCEAHGNEHVLNCTSKKDTVCHHYWGKMENEMPTRETLRKNVRTILNFVVKTKNCVLKTRNCVLKTRNCISNDESCRMTIRHQVSFQWNES